MLAIVCHILISAITCITGVCLLCCIYTHGTCILQILTWVRMYSNYGNISHTSHCMLYLATDVLTTAISTNSITPDSEGTDHSTGILLLIPEWLVLHDIVTIATSNTARTAALIKHTCQEGKSRWMIIGCCVYATGTFMEKSDPSVHNYHNTIIL